MRGKEEYRVAWQKRENERDGFAEKGSGRTSIEIGKFTCQNQAKRTRKVGGICHGNGCVTQETCQLSPLRGNTTDGRIRTRRDDIHLPI